MGAGGLRDAQDAAGLLVARLQLQRDREVGGEPEGQGRQRLAERQGVRQVSSCQASPCRRSGRPRRRAEERRRPGKGRPGRGIRAARRYRSAVRVVTRSTIATHTWFWSSAAHLATKTRRCSGRSLLDGLTISTAATRRRPDRVSKTRTSYSSRAGRSVATVNVGRGGAQTAVATPPPFSRSRRRSVGVVGFEGGHVDLDGRTQMDLRLGDVAPGEFLAQGATIIMGQPP